MAENLPFSLKDCEILNIIPGIVFSLSPSGNILLISHEVERQLGYSVTEVVGKHFSFLIYPEDLPKAEAAFLENIQGKQETRNLLVRIVSKNNAVHWVSVNTMNLRGESGEFLSSIGIVYFNDELHATQEALLKNNEQLQRINQNLQSSYEALGKVNAQISSLSEMNAIVASKMSWEEKILHIMKSIRSFSSAKAVVLRMYDEKKHGFSIRYSLGIPDEWKHVPLLSKEKITQELEQKQQPMYIMDLSLLPHPLDGIAASIDAQAIMLTPLVINEEVFGFLTLFFETKKAAEEFSSQLAMTYTSHLVIALMMSGDLDHALKDIL